MNQAYVSKNKMEFISKSPALLPAILSFADKPSMSLRMERMDDQVGGVSFQSYFLYEIELQKFLDTVSIDLKIEVLSALMAAMVVGAQVTETCLQPRTLDPGDRDMSAARDPGPR